MVGFRSYSVENDEILKKKIEDSLKVVNDLSVPFKIIRDDFYKSQRAIFQLSSAGGYPDFKNGGENSAYARRKQRLYGFKYPLLKATGKLERATTRANAEGSRWEIKPDSLGIGYSKEKIPYGDFHQSDAPRTIMPLRKFMFIGPEAPSVATSEQVGRLQRWISTIDVFVRRSMEAIE